MSACANSQSVEMKVDVESPPGRHMSQCLGRDTRQDMDITSEFQCTEHLPLSPVFRYALI